MFYSGLGLEKFVLDFDPTEHTTPARVQAKSHGKTRAGVVCQSGESYVQLSGPDPPRTRNVTVWPESGHTVTLRVHSPHATGSSNSSERPWHAARYSDSYCTKKQYPKRNSISYFSSLFSKSIRRSHVIKKELFCLGSLLGNDMRTNLHLHLHVLT